MNILHISASPRTAGSHSARLAAAIVERLQGIHPRAQVVLRDLSAEPLPHVDAAYADALAGVARPGAASDAAARSDALITELEQADALVIGTPMHNFTVPSVLKSWIDHVLRIHRTFAPSPEGKRGLLRNRPVYLALASGGLFLGEAARQPDFLTPYLRAVLNTMGLYDLHFFVLQGTVRSEQAAAAWQQALALLDQRFPRAA
ncbi:FMN-dependent NADH-azoreductase [Pseudorhodoferax sp.]|uniref:FMN-dependent NADH-azoreductase n=1 Tax=Pseudorhodoferax sp. TaxID=1993553 RepID=UPI002DD6922F|nr:NAD(P)H-dependent oxidoreductase [Pseudorhodoferax sp.]